MNMDIIIDYSFRIGFSIVVLIITKIVSKVIYNSVLKVSEKTGKDLTYKNTMKVLINVASYTIGIFVILSLIFKDLMPMLTGLGVSGIVIAFAVQEPLSNFISGILLMFSKAIKDNDVIEVNSLSGVVSRIDLNHTIIKTFDGKEVRIPNKTMWGSTITNFWPSDIRRADLNIGVSYNTDLNYFLNILNDYLEKSDIIYTDENHSSLIVFSGFGTSSVDFIIKFWLKREDFLEGSKKVATEIFKLLKEKSIEIPFTQIDLHIKNGGN
jgi:small conductance mechanosensitive channel